MDSEGKDIDFRLAQYTRSRNILSRHRLGFGIDGVVWSTDRATAVKIHGRADTYQRELRAYRRLQEHGVRDVRGHAVPQLIDSDDALYVIEMTIVHPPFLLDFSSAYLDRSPDVPEEAWTEWRADKREQFEKHWPQVEAILRELRAKHGMYLLDTHPGNLQFSDDD
jgi:hypothetical protein